tara:strand:+ start:361 stop:621 length:261 start_codon:yes stop_codon:yes gene_type:complete
MTTTQRTPKTLTKGFQEALIDQLRACQSKEEILKFEEWFNASTDIGPLHQVICEFLRNRSISRGLASKWLLTLIKDRDEKSKKLLT